MAPETWLDVLTFCRDDPPPAFDQLDSLLGDHLPERADAPFAVVAHLLSHTHGHRLRVKTALAEGQALPTVTRLWPSADFDERETWEMYGIVFPAIPICAGCSPPKTSKASPCGRTSPLEGTVGGRVRTDLRGKI